MKGRFEQSKEKEISNKNQKNTSIYQTLWRWHLYAGLFFAPFIFILAVTGSVYLFIPQIEQWMYRDLYVVNDEGSKLPPSLLIEKVTSSYPNSTVVKYHPGEEATRSAEVKINQDNETITVFVDPYSANIKRDLNDKHRLMDRIEEFHGELMLGTPGDRIVELAACWALILVFTGLYLWFPRDKNKWRGIFIPHSYNYEKYINKGFTCCACFLDFGGYVFSDHHRSFVVRIWGTKVQTITTNTGVGYPPSIWVGSALSSGLKTKDIADVPWAAENLDVPSSTVKEVQLSIDQVVSIAKNLEIYPTYDFIFPKTPEGVFTLSVFPPKARDEATVHIGAFLADYRYDNYEHQKPPRVVILFFGAI